MVPKGVLRISFKFYNELQYRFWENKCQINMQLYRHCYIFAKSEPTRFYLLMKTVSRIGININFCLSYLRINFRVQFLRKID